MTQILYISRFTAGSQVKTGITDVMLSKEKMNIRRKRIALSVVVIPLIILALQFQFHSGLKKNIHANKSVNPVATDYFAHAMLVNMEIKFIHDYLFVDYGSFLLKPLWLLEDHFFTMAQRYVRPDNIAEEGVWWSLLHIDKYGFLKQGQRDRSMSLSHLSNIESLAIRNQAYKYFLTVVDTGVKGIDFGRREFSAVYGLFIIPFHNISSVYPGKTEMERIDNYWADYDNYQKELLSYQKYKKYISNNPYLKGKEGVVNSTLIGRLNFLVGVNYIKNNLGDACGQLLDDYLVILTGANLDPNQLDVNRIKTIKAILSGLMMKCSAQQTEILYARKQVNKMEEI